MTRDELKTKLSTLNVLFVDDEVFVVETMKDVLKRLFKQCHFATNGKEGLEKFKKNNINVVITDVSMPTMSGIEMLNEIKKTDSKVKSIFISGHNEQNYLKHSKMFQNEYIVKPITSKALYQALNTLYS